MASVKDIAVLERKLKEAKSNREKIVLAKELKDLKSKLSTTQKKETLPTQRRKIRMLSSEDFKDLIARLKQKPEYSFLKSMGKKKIEDDYRVVAKPVGWRIKGKGNNKVPSKKFRRENPDLVYYENRPDHSDVHRPNRLEQGGMMARGGGVGDRKLQKKVDEVNRLIQLANENDIYVVDSSSTWEAPMKFKPIVVMRGGLKVEYSQLNLYKWNKFGIDNWEKNIDRIKKADMDFENPLNDIAKWHRKALRENAIQYEDGGMMATGGSLKKKGHSVDSNSYASGGKMKKSNLVEYVVPNWSVSALINGDYSGLNDEDEKSLDSFIERVSNECGNAMFMLGDKSDDYEFSHRNDVDRYAGDVTTLYIMPDNSYANGGGLKKKDDDEPVVEKKPMADYDVQLLESQSDNEEEKGKYFMFPKPANDNSKGVLFEKGGQIAVGDWVAEKKGTARGKVYQDTGVFIKLEDKYGNRNNTLYSKSKFKKSVKPRY
jgi:hypothetical protein